MICDFCRKLDLLTWKPRVSFSLSFFILQHWYHAALHPATAYGNTSYTNRQTGFIQETSVMRMRMMTMAYVQWMFVLLRVTKLERKERTLSGGAAQSGALQVVAMETAIQLHFSITAKEAVGFKSVMFFFFK